MFQLIWALCNNKILHMWTKFHSPSLLKYRISVVSGFNLIVLAEMWHFLAWMHLQETYLYVSRLMGFEIYYFVRILCGALCAKFLNSYCESFTPFCFCHFYILCSGFSIQYSPASAWSKKCLVQDIHISLYFFLVAVIVLNCMLIPRL